MDNRNSGSVTWRERLVGAHSTSSFKHFFTKKLDVDGAKISSATFSIQNNSSTSIFILNATVKHPENVLSFQYVSDGPVPSTFNSIVTIGLTYSI